MNLILFESAELDAPLPRIDRRVQHVLNVLGRGIGEPFDAGIVDDHRGKATLTALGRDTVTISFRPEFPPEDASPITLVVGLPRPQTARDILRDATTLGVGALHFVRTEKGEPNYAQSTLWTSGEWRRHLVAGAEQAFTTRLPSISFGRTLAEVLALLPAPGSRIVLDNYEAPQALSRASLARDQPLILAVGGERGWGPADRTALRAGGFAFHHLGPHVLRTETACTCALAIARAGMALM